MSEAHPGEGDGGDREPPDSTSPEGTPPSGPSKPAGPPPPPPDVLPTHSWYQLHGGRGATFWLGGPGVNNDAVEVGVLSSVLEHFDRLLRILRAHGRNLEVKRRGRIVDVPGAPRLVAVPAVAGSYVVPLLYEPAEGEIFAEDGGELDTAIDLLGGGDADILATLNGLPERAGDELVALLHTVSSGSIDLEVAAFVGEEITRRTEVSSSQASQRARSLEAIVLSDVGVDTIVGTLFRIDTKRTTIAIDEWPDDEDDEGFPVVVRATFPLSMLDELRDALHHDVAVEVEVREERRRYERTARARLMTVRGVHRVD